MISKLKEPEKDVILISGYKRSGKDTTAKMMKEMIEQCGQKVEVMSFAEPLKFIAKTIFNISDEQLDEFKNGYKGVYCYDENDNINLLTDFREVLKKLGTEAIKPLFGDDVWVNLIKDKMNKSDADIIIIPDFRFLIEDAFKNSITIRIVNNDIKNEDLHPSETELDGYRFDYYFDNTGYCLTKEVIKEIMVTGPSGDKNV